MAQAAVAVGDPAASASVLSVPAQAGTGSGAKGAAANLPVPASGKSAKPRKPMSDETKQKLAEGRERKAAEKAAEKLVFDKMRAQNERLKKQLAATKSVAKAGGKKAVVATKHASVVKSAQAKAIAAQKNRKVVEREKVKQLRKYDKERAKLERSIAKDVAKNMKAIGSAKRAVAVKKITGDARKKMQAAKRQGLPESLITHENISPLIQLLYFHRR
jgi:hypothetical protein